MIITILRSNLNKTIDPNRDFILDREVIPWRDPVDDDELLMDKDLENIMDEFYKNGTFTGTITDVNKLDIQGVDLVHTNDGLNLRELHEKIGSGFYFGVDKFGRVTKPYPVSSDYFDSSVRVDWVKVTGKPTTVDGYNVTNLVTNDRDYTLTGKVDVIKQPRKTKSPVPYSFLKELWDSSGYDMLIGTLVFRPANSPTKNTKLLRSDGRMIYSKDYPEAVEFYGGKGATQAYLPDTREIETETFANFGFSIIGYCKVKP